MFKADVKKLKTLVSYSWATIITLVLAVAFASYLVATGNNLFGVKIPQLLFIVDIVLYVVFSITAAFSTWYTKWKIDWCKSNSALYGTVTLFVPFVFPFLFQKKGIKEMKVQDEKSQKAIFTHDDEFILEMKTKSSMMKRKRKDEQKQFLTKKKKTILPMIVDPEFEDVVRKLARRNAPNLKRKANPHVVANTNPYINYKDAPIPVDSGAWDKNWVFEEHWSETESE